VPLEEPSTASIGDILESREIAFQKIDLPIINFFEGRYSLKLQVPQRASPRLLGNTSRTDRRPQSPNALSDGKQYDEAKAFSTARRPVRLSRGVRKDGEGTPDVQSLRGGLDLLIWNWLKCSM
jgi:hypothetical protein